MTLIAGLKCCDGIVLAADTEESTAYTRGRVRKLLTRTFSKGAGGKKPPGTVVVAIAGAGGAALIDSAVEAIFDAVDRSRAATVDGLKKTIRGALLSFYRSDVSAYPTRDPLDNVIDLVVGVRAASGELSLFRASGPLISTVSGFALCGSGEIIRHVLEELYEPTIDVPRAVALVVHLLNLGKRYVAGVGGDSEILTLTRDGIPTQESVQATRIKERHLDDFNRMIGALLLQFPDGSVTPEVFGGAMTSIATDVQRLRERQASELRAEVERQPGSSSSSPEAGTSRMAPLSPSPTRSSARKVSSSRKALAKKKLD